MIGVFTVQLEFKFLLYYLLVISNQFILFFKVWKISKPSNARLTIHCNGIMVVDIKVSNVNCSAHWQNWNNWKNRMELMKVKSTDTASDFYNGANAIGN